MKIYRVYEIESKENIKKLLYEGFDPLLAQNFQTKYKGNLLKIIEVWENERLLEIIQPYHQKRVYCQ